MRILGAVFILYVEVRKILVKLLAKLLETHVRSESCPSVNILLFLVRPWQFIRVKPLIVANLFYILVQQIELLVAARCLIILLLPLE